MLDRLLDHFSTLYIGIMGALVLHAVILFFLLFKNIHTPAAELSTGIKREVEVEVITKEEAEMQDLLAENPDMTPDEIRNVTTDANDDRERSSTDYGQIANSEQLDEQVQEQYAREFEELFNETRSERANVNHDNLPDATDLSATNYEENVSLRDKNKAFAGRGMAHLDLSKPRRTSRRGYLKVPGYTGLQGGTIIIQIVVDQSGYVIEANVDYASSTITDPTAIETALNYAKRERFNRDESAPKKQSGTITYTFKAQ